MSKTATIEAVEVPVGATTLKADLRVPASATGLVIFAHGSGSSRFSTRNRQVAEDRLAAHDAGRSLTAALAVTAASCP